jgi:hypothetical protein
MTQSRSRSPSPTRSRTPEVAAPAVVDPVAEAAAVEGDGVGASADDVRAVGAARGNQAAAALADSAARPAGGQEDGGIAAGGPRTPAQPHGDNWIHDFIEDGIWGPEEPATGGGAPTPAPAPRTTAWWDAYQAETDAGRREQMVVAETAAGRMQAHFDELDRTQRLGAYRERFQEALDYYQLHATLDAAGRTEPQLAQAQGDHMQREDERVVRERSGAGHAPSQAERDQARAELNQQDYVTEPPANQLVWPNLSPAEQAAWQARGAAARGTLVAWINARHPEYALRIDQIVVNFGRVERLGAVAYAQGNDTCTIGFTVVEAVEQNPQFAVSTVVHELFGHNEFDRGFSVTERLFREAVARQRGVRPEEVQLTADEWSRFNYFESEIASLVWEYDLSIARDAQGRTNPLGTPEDLMVSLMRNLQSQWAPDLVVPLFTGLYRRFQADPALSDAAAEFFRASAQRHLGISLQ